MYFKKVKVLVEGDFMDHQQIVSYQCKSQAFKKNFTGFNCGKKFLPNWSVKLENKKECKSTFLEDMCQIGNACGRKSQMKNPSLLTFTDIGGNG
ncbi:hypothetical protein CAEBREN_09160 [Caenorhabditis brenneri]|uniref:Uncharacterized protein n=1 Tax=Caenorhabditis brenneri TaxID=135651 RepID=G0NW72_CAEBE|nr:hypothetical protein CAEBREN_09160 [Caenorhabditis brenneri]